MVSETDARELKICYVTCAENGFYGLKKLHHLGYCIAQVVTISGSVAQRFNVSGFADVRSYCSTLSIPLLVLDDYKIRSNVFEKGAIDVVIVNGWNRLLPQDLLSRARFGGLGIHAGHPPLGLGRAPLVWNILLGNLDIEAYVFRLTERADDGDILSQCTIEITPFDDVGSLYQKVMVAGPKLFVDAIHKLANSVSGKAQSSSDVRHFEKRTPEDGLIDFFKSEVELYNFIRAQSAPYPGAFCYLDNELWRIWRAVPFDRFAFREGSRKPGEIVAALPSGLVVQTGGSCIWIQRADRDGQPFLPAELDVMEGFVGRRFTGRSTSD